MKWTGCQPKVNGEENEVLLDYNGKRIGCQEHIIAMRSGTV